MIQLIQSSTQLVQISSNLLNSTSSKSQKFDLLAKFASPYSLIFSSKLAVLNLGYAYPWMYASSE